MPRRRPNGDILESSSSGLAKTLPYRVTFPVPKIRRGGYILFSWKSDHPPRHVHVHQEGRLIVKWDLENKKAMKGKASSKIRELVRQLEAEGQL